MGLLQAVLGAGKGVGAQEADGLLRSGALLLDVREPAEWRAGHAPGARHVPLGGLKEQLDNLPRGRRIVVVCRSGGRSARATALLVGNGLQAVNLNGGMRAWAAAGLLVEADGSRTGAVV